MAISLRQYAEEKRIEAGESAIPSGIRKRWRERIVANGWHEMGEEGATKYLDKYGRNIGAPKVVQFARQAEAESCPKMAQGFWRKAYEMEMGHAPPAGDADDEPVPVTVPLEATWSWFQGMEAQQNIEGLTMALCWKRDEDPNAPEWQKASKLRAEVANALARIGDARAVDALVEALRLDPDREVRQAAAEALGQIGDPRAVEPLIEALQEPAPTKGGVVWALGRIGDARAVEPLVETLKDYRSSDVIQALGRIGDTRAVESLGELLGSSDPSWQSWNKREAAKALGQIAGPRAARALTNAFADDDGRVRAAAVEALKRIDKTQATDATIEALKNGDPSVRANAIDALGQIGNERAAQVLIEALKDPAWEVRWNAAANLGQARKTQAIEALLGAISDNEPRVRSAVASALGQIGNPCAIEALARTLTDDDPGVGSAAAEALGEIGDERAIEPLVRALIDDAPRVRSAAAYALGQIGDERAVEPLVKTLADDARQVASSAVEALGRIGDVRAVEALSQTLKNHADAEVRYAVAEALGRIGDAQAVDALSQTLKNHADAKTRRAAAKALGQTGDVRAVEACVATLNDDPDRTVRRYAASALKQIDDDRMMEVLIAALPDANEEGKRAIISALGQLGDARAVEALLEATRDDTTKGAAAEALGQVGDARAVDALAEILEGSSGFTQSRAAKALGRIGNDRAVDVLVKALNNDGGKPNTNAVRGLELVGNPRAEKALQAFDGMSATGLSIDLPPGLEEFRANIEATIKPYVQITAIPDKGMSLWQSKYRGQPYMPQDFPYPRGSNGQPLVLLAQINFAEVPRLEPFPQQGILQFYIDGDDLYGVNYDDPTAQEDFRILYFPQVIKDASRLVTDFDFLPQDADLPVSLPISSPCSLKFVRRYAPISVKDYRFQSQVFGLDTPQPRERLRDLREEYDDLFGRKVDKIGGYPGFVQEDPRVKSDLRHGRFDILLLSPADGDWGDMGVASFLMREEDLRRRDFSRVIYYWDCG